jgi:hypothetical protein
LAFVAAEALWVAAIDGSDTRRVAPLQAPPEALAWSPSGSHLAYLLGSDVPTGLARNVGVADAAGGEIARLPGAAFCWGAKQPALLVADLQRQRVVHHRFDDGSATEVSDIADDGDVRYPPRLVMAPAGRRVAVVSRQARRGVTELWTLTRTADGWDREPVTELPGVNVRVEPMWSSKAVSLAMHVAHRTLGKSAVILLPQLRGEGQVLRVHDRLDPPFCPAWSPSGERIACFVAAQVEPRLCVIDTRAAHPDREPEPAQPAGASVVAGDLRFTDDRTLVVDGGEAAQLLRL